MKGFVDIHAHILPGIDDGPEDLPGALEMARSAVESGITRMAATPHLRSDFPDVHLEEIGGRVEQVQAELRAAGIELEVVAGAEVSLLWALDASEEQLRLASFAQRGRDLLIETPSDVSMLERLLQQVADRGFRITLAHPERSATFRQDPAKLERLAARGVLLQVNADPLLAVAGSSARRLAERLCRDGLAHVVASDGHRGQGRRPVGRLASAFGPLSRLVGPERAGWLVSDSPTAILDVLALPPIPPVSGKAVFWRRWSR